MSTEPELAIWVLTPGGLNTARKLTENMKRTVLFLSESIDDSSGGVVFRHLSESVSRYFRQYRGHVFFMSTGIVVRVIARHLRHKTSDPAVVVADDNGKFVISLVSGHLGGANDLAWSVAGLIGGIPVITSATDVNGLPSIDLVARRQNLAIENPELIKIVNMAFVKERKVFLHDPYSLLKGLIPEPLLEESETVEDRIPAVAVDDRIRRYSENTLVLRPRILTAGIGCNRGTSMEEIRDFLIEICRIHKISISSIRSLASIELKKDEPGILSLGMELKVPVLFYGSRALDNVKSIENPSDYAKEYTGARSVCEAAAILGSDSGKLIVSKKKTSNVTVALARERNFCML